MSKKIAQLGKLFAGWSRITTHNLPARGLTASAAIYVRSNNLAGGVSLGESKRPLENSFACRGRTDTEFTEITIAAVIRAERAELLRDFFWLLRG